MATNGSKREARQLLCLSTYPSGDASVRHRFLRYGDELSRAGWEIKFETILTQKVFATKNRPGFRASLYKTMHLLLGLLRRIAVLATCRSYDAVWIHREAFPFFTPLAERWVRRIARGTVIIDFDDALWAPPPGGSDWRSPLRNRRRFSSALRCADVVIAGSRVLAEWARARGANVILVPTCVDTEVAARAADRSVQDPSGRLITIGWIGSWSTASYLVDVMPALKRVADQERCRFLFIGASNLTRIARNLPMAEVRLWSEADEQDDLAEFDIGIMPLADNEWNRGKCGFKLLQYMSMGIPFVASPVGMNKQLVDESGGGVLCGTEDEWVASLTMLLRDRRLRDQLGRAAQAHAVHRYDYRGYSRVILGAIAGEYS